MICVIVSRCKVIKKYGKMKENLMKSCDNLNVRLW